MKKTNLKTLWIFTLSIFAVILISSCSVDKKVAEDMMDKDETTHEDIMDKDETIVEDESIEVESIETEAVEEESIEEEVTVEETIEEETVEEEVAVEETVEKEEMSEHEEMEDKTEDKLEEEMVKDEVALEGKYLDYTPELLAEAEWNIVLFFHADWCPTCNALEKEILSDTIPSDLTILVVNYDTETELKKKYSVLTQTTLVQVDNQWNMINKWVWGRDLEDIQSRLK